MAIHAGNFGPCCPMAWTLADLAAAGASSSLSTQAMLVYVQAKLRSENHQRSIEQIRAVSFVSDILLSCFRKLSTSSVGIRDPFCSCGMPKATLNRVLEALRLRAIKRAVRWVCRTPSVTRLY